jgi:hypothetical protein
MLVIFTGSVGFNHVASRTSDTKNSSLSVSVDLANRQNKGAAPKRDPRFLRTSYSRLSHISEVGDRRLACISEITTV